MAKRRKLDAYYTPEWAAKELLKHITITGTHRALGESYTTDIVLEPCSGDNIITQVLVHSGDAWVVNNDIDESKLAEWHLDARDPSLYDAVLPDWVITNPPFSQAFEIVSIAHRYATSGVAMLLRLSFLEPTYKRQAWLAANPPNKLIVLPRISFTGDGKTDSCTVAWMIWDKSGESFIKIVTKE